MSEIRQNLLNGNWAVMAPERGEKPAKLKQGTECDLLTLPEYDPDCPFCPNNEKHYPLELINEIKDEKDTWSLRLIENKYKIFDNFATCPIEPEPFSARDIYTYYQGCGNHYLVIETPLHNQAMGKMSTNQIINVFRCYHDSSQLLRKNGNNLIAVIFKNQGARAGGSQPHAHSQIVGSRVVPAWIRNALHVQERYFDYHGMCAMCRIIEYEQAKQERLVLENENILVLSPYAASSAYDLWVVPKHHFACYIDITDAVIIDLAKAVRTILTFYLDEIGNPDFNLVIHSSPFMMASIPYYHTFIQITPAHIRGGFEVGTNIPVNTIMPEQAAKNFHAWKSRR